MTETITGLRMQRGALLGISNAKTVKGEALGVLTGVMFLAPYMVSGRNVCAMASDDCIRDCLYTSGRGAMQRTKDARVARTLRFWNERPAFMAQLASEIMGLEAIAARHGLSLAIRLNGTSDILWERQPVTICGAPHANLMRAFPNVRFYDYTKHKPAKRWLPVSMLRNYDLVFSAQRHTLKDACEALGLGWNVAAVVSPADHAALLAIVDGARFHDASAHDARMRDPMRSVGLLIAKGTLKRETPDTSRMILTRDEAARLGRAAWYAFEHFKSGNPAHLGACHAQAA